MNNYCPYNLALKFKKAGFNEVCETSYGTLPVDQDGTPIDDCEEIELLHNGKGSEIKYVPGGVVYNYSCTNSELDGEPLMGGCEECARMTFTEAEDWLNKRNIVVSVEPYVTVEGFFYLFKVFEIVKNTDMMVKKIKEKTGFDSIESARVEGMSVALEHIRN